MPPPTKKELRALYSRNYRLKKKAEKAKTNAKKGDPIIPVGIAVRTYLQRRVNLKWRYIVELTAEEIVEKHGVANDFSPEEMATMAGLD